MGRSLYFEAFSRFVDKVKSPGLEVALGTAHVLINRGAAVKSRGWRTLVGFHAGGPRDATSKIGDESPQIPICGFDRRRAARYFSCAAQCLLDIHDRLPAERDQQVAQ